MYPLFCLESLTLLQHRRIPTDPALLAQLKKHYHGQFLERHEQKIASLKTGLEQQLRELRGALPSLFTKDDELGRVLRNLLAKNEQGLDSVSLPHLLPTGVARTGTAGEDRRAGGAAAAGEGTAAAEEQG